MALTREYSTSNNRTDETSSVEKFTFRVQARFATARTTQWPRVDHLGSMVSKNRGPPDCFDP
mgnify:FL=1